MTNYRRTFDPTKLSASTPPEERMGLPAPEVLSEVYRYDNLFAVDLKCHNGRMWSLVDTRLKELEYKLKYFKSLDREVIRDLFMTFPKSPMAIIQWPKRTGWECVNCGSVARNKPGCRSGPEVFGCAKCDKEVEIRKPVVSVKPPKPDTGIPVSEPKTDVPVMNAMQRLRAKKGIK